MWVLVAMRPTVVMRRVMARRRTAASRWPVPRRRRSQVDGLLCFGCPLRPLHAGHWFRPSRVRYGIGRADKTGGSREHSEDSHADGFGHVSRQHRQVAQQHQRHGQSESGVQGPCAQRLTAFLMNRPQHYRHAAQTEQHRAGHGIAQLVRPSQRQIADQERVNRQGRQPGPGDASAVTRSRPANHAAPPIPPVPRRRCRPHGPCRRSVVYATDANVSTAAVISTTPSVSSRTCTPDGESRRDGAVCRALSSAVTVPPAMAV